MSRSQDWVVILKDSAATCFTQWTSTTHLQATGNQNILLFFRNPTSSNMATWNMLDQNIMAIIISLINFIPFPAIIESQMIIFYWYEWSIEIKRTAGDTRVFIEEENLMKGIKVIKI